MKRFSVVFALSVVALLLVSVRDNQAGIITVDETTIAAFGTVNQNDVQAADGGGGANSCSPTATMNSFTWLTNAYPNNYVRNGMNLLEGGQATWTAAATLLASAAYMNTSSKTGTSGLNWALGKFDYIQNFAPGSTTFAGMYNGNIGVPWVQNQTPTLPFLLSQLQQGEDVEIGILPGPNAGPNAIGHALTLTGLTWNDANNNGVFDGGDMLTLNTVDPGNPTVNTPLTLNPGNPMTISGPNYNGYSLVLAYAESPVPEPSSLILLSVGAASLAGYGWRRRKLAAAAT